MTTDETTLGTELRRIRKEKRFTATAVAKAADIAVTTYSNIEHERLAVPGTPIVERIIAVLEVDDEQADTLRVLAAQGRKSLRIDLDHLPREAVATAVRFDRAIGRLPASSLAKIDKLLAASG